MRCIAGSETISSGTEPSTANCTMVMSVVRNVLLELHASFRLIRKPAKHLMAVKLETADHATSEVVAMFWLGQALSESQLVAMHRYGAHLINHMV